MALGFGYNYDLLNHGLTIAEENNEVTFQVDNSGAINTLTIHNLEFPFEFRWRNSDAQTYKFWRVYMGVKPATMYLIILNLQTNQILFLIKMCQDLIHGNMGLRSLLDMMFLQHICIMD